MYGTSAEVKASAAAKHARKTNTRGAAMTGA
jgi:hypothetical protein